MSVLYLTPREEASVALDLLQSRLPWWWRPDHRREFMHDVETYASARAQVALTAYHPEIRGDVGALSERIAEHLAAREWAVS